MQCFSEQQNFDDNLKLDIFFTKGYMSSANQNTLPDTSGAARNFQRGGGGKLFELNLHFKTKVSSSA